MLGNGIEFRFHEDDLARIYDPCIPIVVAWDGSANYWPSEIVSRESLNNWKLGTLWQQIDITQVHFRRAEFEDFSEEDQRQMVELGASMENCKKILTKYIPPEEKPTKVRTGLLGPILPHVDMGPKLLVPDTPGEQPEKRKGRREEKDEQARRDRERRRRDRDDPEPQPGTSSSADVPDEAYREDIDTVSSESDEEEAGKKKKGRQRQKCPEDGCKESFQRLAQLKDHLYHTHRKADKPNCDVCGKTYQYWRGVSRHKKEVHKNHWNYVCSEDKKNCNKKFESRDKWVRHLKYAHGKGQSGMKCHHCDKICPCKSSLKRHVESGGCSGLRVVLCTLCSPPKGYCNVAALDTHIRFYHGVEDDKEVNAAMYQEWKCYLCDQSLDSRVALFTHMQKHKKNEEDKVPSTTEEEEEEHVEEEEEDQPQTPSPPPPRRDRKKKKRDREPSSDGSDASPARKKPRRDRKKPRRDRRKKKKRDRPESPPLPALDSSDDGEEFLGFPEKQKTFTTKDPSSKGASRRTRAGKQPEEQQDPGQQPEEEPGQQVPEEEPGQQPGQQVPEEEPGQQPGQQVPEDQPGQQVPGQQVPEDQPGQQVPGQPISIPSSPGSSTASTASAETGSGSKPIPVPSSPGSSTATFCSSVETVLVTDEDGNIISSSTSTPLRPPPPQKE